MPSSTKSERKHVSIVFTDIVGFTALSSNNEPAALALLEKQRKLLKPVVDSYDGEWLKEIGDGLLLTFPTASAAVQCAIDIQKIASDHSDLVLRIGIHEGEVTATEGDIIGDDVNVASRIEPFSAPGGIAISGKIQQNISSLPDFKTMYLGQPKLKGVRQKVEIHCIVSQGLPKPDLKTVKAKLDLGQQSLFKKYVFPITGALFTLIGGFIWLIFPLISFTTASTRDYDNKIAVLYFDNKGEQSDDYISEGLTQEIIARLSKIKTLSVASRFDVAGYKSSSVDLDEIKNKLDLNFLLTGFIRKLDSHLIISVELIELDSRKVFWAETYNKKVDDIFEIQKEVSLNVVDNLGIELNISDEKSLILDPAKNNKVYNMLLKVKYNAYKLNTDTTSLQKMVDELDTIIEIDSTFADALATRAFTTFLLYFGKEARRKPDSQESKDFYDRILNDANSALYYDPNNFVAISIFPFTNLLKLSQSKNSPTQMIFLGRQALVGVNEMIDKVPNHYISQFIQGMYHQIRALLTANKPDYDKGVYYLNKAIDQTRKGVDNNIADPMVKMIYNKGTWWLAELHYRFEYYSHVISLYDELIALHSHNNASYRLKKTLRKKGTALIKMGYFEESIDNYIKLNKISGDDKFNGNLYSFYSITQLAYSYIQLNQYQVGIDILMENPPSDYYDDWDKSKYFLAYQYELFLGEGYAGLNKFEKSNYHLLRAIEGTKQRIELTKNIDPSIKYTGSSIGDVVNEYGQYSLIPKSILALNKSFSKNRNDVEELVNDIHNGIEIYGITDSYAYFQIIANLTKVYQNIGDDANFEKMHYRAKTIKKQIAEKLIEGDKEVFDNNIPSDKRLYSLLLKS